MQAAPRAFTRFHERSVPFRSRGSIWLGPRLAASAHAGWFAPKTETATRRGFVLPRAFLRTSDMGVWFEGGGHPLPPGHDHAAPIDQGWVLGCNAGWRDPEVWLTQCLPAIDHALSLRDARRAVLALPPLEPWREATLAAIGAADHPRFVLAADTLYRVAELYYGEWLSMQAPYEVSGSLGRTFQRLAPPGETRHGGGKLFILPMDGGPRNLFDLADAFRARGFLVFVPDPRNVAEQIAVFRAATHIASPCAGALSFLAFCRPGTLVCEFFPDQRCDPRHQRLAQAADLHYRAEAFASEAGGWTVPVDALDWVWDPPGPLVAPGPSPRYWLNRRADRPDHHGLSLAGMLAGFQSLGEDCEFGLVQRDAGIEPLGLLRFASLHVPGETRLAALIEALDSSFNGVGDPDTVSVRVEGEPGEIPEYMVSDTRWQLLMHSFRAPGRVSEPAMRRQAATLLDFLRRKLQEDLASGNPIWVWKACYKVTEPEVCELLAALRRHGPNRLLWVAQSDDAHPPGTVEQLGPHLVRGFVAPPSGGRLENFAAGPWLSVCRAAHLWLRRYPAHTVT